MENSKTVLKGVGLAVIAFGIYMGIFNGLEIFLPYLIAGSVILIISIAIKNKDS